MQTPSVANSPAAAQWIPVCLPKFNPSGFVNAYISHLTRDIDQSPRPSMIQSAERQDRAMDLPIRDEYSGLSLVCISGGGEFETVRTWCSAVTKVSLSLFSCDMFLFFPETGR